MKEYIKVDDLKKLQGNDRFKSEALGMLERNKIPTYSLEELE